MMNNNRLFEYTNNVKPLNGYKTAGQRDCLHCCSLFVDTSAIVSDTNELYNLKKHM
jgi:hypothetical protein